MLLFTLYFISSISVLASSIVAPAMGEMYTHFQTSDPTLIKLILTMPALFMVPGTFLSVKLAKKYGKKNVLLVALVIYSVGGTITAFMPTIESILICRAILGLGVGILTPICQSLPSDFYNGMERTKVVGRQGSSISLGNMICTLFAGWLAAFSWRYTFLVYLVGFVVFIFVLLFLPQRKPEAETKEQEIKSTPVPLSIYGIAFGMFLFMLAIYALFTNLAIFMQEKGIGTAATTGYVLAFNSLISFTLGFMLPRIHSLLKNYMLVVILLLVGTGYFVFYYATNLPTIILGAFLTSMAMGALMPTIILAISNRANHQNMVKSMAFLSCGMFLGQFASPLILDLIPVIPYFDGPGSTFAMLGIGIYFTAFLSLIVALFTKKNAQVIQKN